MCTGAEIALMAASAGGNLLQNAAENRYANQVADAQNQRLEQYLKRNRKREDEATALFDQRKDAADPTAVAETESAATDVRQSSYDQATADAATASAPVSRGSLGKVFDSLTSDVREKETARQGETFENRAAASGATDGMFSRMLADAAAGNRLGTVAGFARSDASMLPTYQDLAAATVRKPMPIGAMISGAANFGAMRHGAKTGAR